MRRLISVWQYATNFGTTRKESLKRIKSGKPVILYILRRTTLFLRRVYRAAKFVTSLAAERGGNHHERMGRTLQTSEAGNRSKRDNERRSRRSSTSCVREGKNWNMKRAFFPDSCTKSSAASVSNESVLLSTSTDCTVVTFNLSVTRKFPKSSSYTCQLSRLRVENFDLTPAHTCGPISHA